MKKSGQVQLLQDIEAEHRDLHEKWHAIDAAHGRVARLAAEGRWHEDLREHLVALREFLKAHFHLEETQGGLNVAGGGGDRDEIRELIAEHRRFEHEVEGLINAAHWSHQRRVPLPERFSERLNTLRHELSLHEAKEDTLFKRILAQA